MDTCHHCVDDDDDEADEADMQSAVPTTTQSMPRNERSVTDVSPTSQLVNAMKKNSIDFVIGTTTDNAATQKASCELKKMQSTFALCGQTDDSSQAPSRTTPIRSD